MFTGKDSARRLWPRAGTGLALALLSLTELGCSSITGLRSIGTDRPSMLGFWDRSPQPRPDPGADYYARYMHSAKDRADALANRSAQPPGATRDEPDAEPGTPGDGALASNDAREGPGSGRKQSASRSTKPPRDETIRVTLGPPEPLPALAGPAEANENMELASNSSGVPSGWTTDRRPDRTDAEIDPGPAPALEPPSTRARHDEPARDRPGASPAAPPATPDIGDLLARGEAKLRSLDTYQVKIARIERVGGQLQPEEQIVLSVRRDPKAVRLEWAEGPNQGREVIYSPSLDARSLFVHMPKSAIPLPTMKIAVDSPLIMMNSRHPIADAGLDTIIKNLRESTGSSRKPDLGRLVYHGVQKPPGLDRPSHVLTRRSPSGETWTVFLDADTMLPCMVVAKGPTGELDEKYIYHEVRENRTELSAAGAFDPDRRWGESNGLLSRFARAAAGTGNANNRQSTTR